MLSVADAQQIILNHSAPSSATPITLPDALGLVLAEAVTADADSPPFDKAMMDGAAVSLATPTKEWEVIGSVTAGIDPTCVVGPGQAVRITTGAKLPAGADAVLKIEDIEEPGPGRLRIGKDRNPIPHKGQHILKQGSEYHRGDAVLEAGTPITPAVIGILAGLGVSQPKIHSAPRINILSTGDEIVEPNQTPGPGGIRNSNGPMLTALAKEVGATVRYLGIARDDKAMLQRMIREGLESADILILSGGVSMGQLDLVPPTLAEEGVEILFHKVAVKPGKPLLFGRRGGQLVFGLPGNPVSSLVAFHLFVLPAIRKMLGRTPAIPPVTEFPLTEPLKANHDRPTYLPGRMEGDGVKPLTWFGSADLRAYAKADCLIVVPAGEHAFAAGSPLSAIRIQPNRAG